MLHRVLGVSLLVGSLIAWIGCGTSNTSGTVPAAVTVTYRGQPVEGATVTFHPAGSEQRGSVARTDASGRADVWTFDPGDGVMPGSYNVTVTKVVGGLSPDTYAARWGGVDQESMSPQELAEYEAFMKKAESEPLKHEVPEKYSRPATSDLTAEVSDGGDNQFTFELQD